ncbi:hypothetical protein [Leptolyngbya phage Lbo240-yong1]|uniref:Uncharacterized protein n=1 Tax=Leptolyngbya phage Lbo240-yong1 TaxID=2928836 RepID=A0A9X9E579_9CAUD|nr:hypothetical protein [Leptolyngbya phage Lbo240-yong1]
MTMTTTEMLELITWQAREIKTLSEKYNNHVRASMQLQAIHDSELHRTRQELDKVRKEWGKAYEQNQGDLMRKTEELDNLHTRYMNLEIQYNRLVNQVNKSCNA